MQSKLVAGIAGLVLSAVFSAVPATADTIIFSVNLTGSAESPPNMSPGIGTALITFDTIADTLRLQGSFSGLTTPTNAAHIHCCTAIPSTGTAGVATIAPTFPGFPLGVTSGTYDSTLNMLDPASYNPPS